MLKQRFTKMYDRGATSVVRAPGRVNLIGEHTDYNDGFVLPVAIERQIVAAVSPRPDRLVRLASLQTDTSAEIDLDAYITPGQPTWANFCKGVAAGLLAEGVDLCGADILFDSDIPLGAGLSSSAALEVCTAMAMLAAADAIGVVPDHPLAELCQRAEQDYAGAPVGIMDQAISVMGRAGQALLLDCRSGETELIPFDNPELELIVVDTRVAHSIGDGQYAQRRQTCESAAAKLGLNSLRDANADDFAASAQRAELSVLELMRARHVVGEIARTLEAAAALKAGDYGRFGELMYASHESLRVDYEVTCAELDAVVESARTCDGVYGARMTGGGFGGCAIILARTDAIDAINEKVSAAFAKQFGRDCSIFNTRAVDGAGLIE